MISFEDLTTSFQARHLEVPIERAVSVALRTPAGAAAASLKEHNFDQAPVMVGPEVVGYVLRARLEELAESAPVSAALCELRPGVLVSGDAPIADLLNWIVIPRLLFVLAGNRVSGFVTVFDFNKQPARAYLYWLFAGLEMALGELVRRCYGVTQDGMLGFLADQQAGAIRRARDKDREANAEGDLVSYMTLAHLLRIAGADPRVGGVAGVENPEDWDREVRTLTRLRNSVMHPIREVVGRDRSVEELRALERRTRWLLEACLMALGGTSMGVVV